MFFNWRLKWNVTEFLNTLNDIVDSRDVNIDGITVWCRRILHA